MHTRESPPRLLLVEDDATSQGFFHATLEALPATVEIAGTLAQAQQLARATRHALWLIDLNLPDGNGVQLLQRLRSHQPGVPALAHTADDTPALRQALLQAGFAEVLVKPMATATLLDAVRRLLGSPVEVDTAVAGDAPDWDEGAALSALNGQPAHVQALRQLFLAELPDTRQAVDTALRQHDAAALRTQLHRLQASCGFVGASRLGRAVQKLRHAPDSAGAHLAFATAVDALLRE